MNEITIKTKIQFQISYFAPSTIILSSTNIFEMQFHKKLQVGWPE